MSWKSWNGAKVKRLTDNATARALFNAGEAVKGKVLQEVPHDEGLLASTVQVFVNPNNKLDVTLSAGGGHGTGMARVPYAIKWHEIPANFQKGRKHNYVRDPMNSFAPTAVKRSLEKELGKTW